MKRNRRRKHRSLKRCARQSASLECVQLARLSFAANRSVVDSGMFSDQDETCVFSQVQSVQAVSASNRTGRQEFLKYLMNEQDNNPKGSVSWKKLSPLLESMALNTQSL